MGVHFADFIYFFLNTQWKWNNLVSLNAGQGEHSAILLTFMKLPFVIKIFVLSIFEWPFYTGFTVHDEHRYPTVHYKFAKHRNKMKRKWFKKECEELDKNLARKPP